MGKSVCYLCKKAENKTIQSGVRHGSGFKVKKCINCGLVFLYPTPDEKELRHYYKSQYRKDYRDPSSQERFSSDLSEAKIRLNRLKKNLASHISVLEIGCGTGAFLNIIRPFVKSVTGVEVDSDSQRWITDKLHIPVFSDIREINPGTRFDVIVMFHVLEHLPDPVAYLAQLKNFLAEGGRIFIEVPDIDDGLISLYNIEKFKRFYFQRAHLYYFSKNTLREVCSKAGLKVSIKGIQRYDFSNHIRWMITGLPGGQGFYRDVFPDSFCKIYENILIKKGYSDTLWAIAKKP